MNIESLLQPISPDAPCGEDLSFSLEFDALVELRREDDPTLDQGEWIRPLKVADWPGVVARCEALLVGRTKDLRVAGWLADAAARVRGHAGLADGLEVCARLCAEHWAGLHPQPDDDGDPAARAGSLAWLLAQVPGLSRRALADATPADDAAAASDVAAANGGPAPARAATPRDMPAAIERGLAALDRLQRVVDGQLGADGPAFGAARKALEDALAHAARLAPRPPAAQGGSTSRDDEAPSTATPPPDGPGHATLRNRADALQQLRAVADFFRRTEPHSPVAYLADKAAAWGDMPLHAWLRTVLKDTGSLAHVEELLGVVSPSEPG